MQTRSYERAAPIILLIVVPLLCWSWIVVLARDMYGPMSGASAWMMTAHWDAPHLLLLWAMWAVMMIGMMLPSAAPMILLADTAARACLLGLGYVLVWAVFSVGATALQWTLGKLLILNAMMEVSSRGASAVLLVIAGVYQWMPVKHACLTTCQSPMAFLGRRWRSGRWGAFRMGLEHGVACVGCCWALMLLLFVGGVMNLAVILALTVFVTFEKLAPVGVVSARVSGVLLLAAAAWMLAG